MKCKTKRILSALLVFVMLFLCIPNTVFAANSEYTIDLESIPEQVWNDSKITVKFILDGDTENPIIVSDDPNLGSPVRLDIPFMNGSVSFIPIRAICDALSLNCKWVDESEKTEAHALITTPKGQVKLYLGATSITTENGTIYEENTYLFPDGSHIPLCLVRDGRVYVPVRFLSTFILGSAKYEWSQNGTLFTITGSFEDFNTPGFDGVGVNTELMLDIEDPLTSLPNAIPVCEQYGVEVSCLDNYYILINNGFIDMRIDFGNKVVITGFDFGFNDPMKYEIVCALIRDICDAESSTALIACMEELNNVGTKVLNGILPQQELNALANRYLENTTEFANVNLTLGYSFDRLVLSNVNENSGGGTVSDTTPPVISTSSINTWNNTNVNITIRATDESGINSLRYATNENSPQSGTISSGNTITLVNEGIYNLNITATDIYGNTAYKTVPINIDKTAPTLTVPSTSNWNKSNISLNITASDLNMESVSYTTNETTPQKGNLSIKGGTINLTNEGEYTLTIIAKDKANNKSVVTRDVKIDKTAPIITNHNVIEQKSTSKGVIINFDISENGSGFKNINYKLPNENTLKTLPDGEKSIVIDKEISGDIDVYAIDNAENTSIKYTVSNVIVDQTPPVINATEISGWHNSNVLINVSASDNSGIKEINWATNENSPTKGSYNGNNTNITMSNEGEYLLTIKAIDNVGNEQSISRTIRIDKTKPIISSHKSTEIEIEGMNIDKNVNVNFNISENESGMDFIEYKLSDEKEYVRTNHGITEFTISRKYSGPISVYAYDMAGNKSNEYVVNDVSISFKPNVENSEIIKPGETLSEAVLYAEPAVFSITMPTKLPVNIDNLGNVITASDIKISNNGNGPVKIDSVEVITKNNWTLVDSSFDFKSEKIGHKNFKINISGIDAPSSGNLDVSSLDSIPGNTSLNLDYNVEASLQRTSISEGIADIVFTVSWDE